MLNLINPFIFAPVKLGYANNDGQVNEKHLSFYGARSKNIGAIIYEPQYLDAGLRELPTQLGIDGDEKIEGLQKLNDLVHKNGAKTIAHLNHPGRMANPRIPGNYFLSSATMPCENGGAIPKSMDKADVEQVKRLFSNAAIRAEKAGFDFIEIQFGHGYLLAQFISPAVNHRNDEFGGNFDNRIRFPLEVLEAVQKKSMLPIIARISGDEMTSDGFHIDDMIQFAKILESKGVVAIHVSAGSACSTPPWFFQHMFVPKGKTWEMADVIKRNVEVPVIRVGRINSIYDVDQLIHDFPADYIALGRALVADPDFTAKYLKIIQGNIRPCLACSEGCLGGVKEGKGLGCIVNPLVGHEQEILLPAKVKKHIAVVGAGLSGMQAAITLHERGHQVTVFEKNKIGGQFNLAWLPPNKASLKELLNFYAAELSDHSIDIVYQNADEKILLNSGFDEAIIATGALPTVPPVKGLQKYYWADFLETNDLPKHEHILIIGGGLIGIEMASKLVDLDNKVIVVEMLNDIARGMEMLEKKLTMQKLQKNNVEIHLNTKVLEIVGDTVYYEKEGSKRTFESINKIIMATGMKSVNDLMVKLSGKIPLHIVGDADKPGKAQSAIATAYFSAVSV